MRFGLFFCCCALLLASCKKDNGPILFEIPYQVEFEIPAGLNTFETHFFDTNNIPTRMAETLNARGLTVNDITSIDPKSARLSNILGDANYDFILEASIELFRAAPNGQDSSRLEVFWHPQVSTNTGLDLDLPGTLSDAKDYVTEEQINVRLKIKLREFSPTFISTRLKFDFVVR